MTYTEIKPEVINEPWMNYYDQYEYWQIQEQLTPWIEVKEQAIPETWLKVVNGQLSVNWWTWTTYISWLPFRPTYIQFQAVSASSFSQMSTDWNYNNWSRIYYAAWQERYTTTSRAAELYNDSTNQYTLLDFAWFQDDWFWINLIRVDFSTTLMRTAMA